MTDPKGFLQIQRRVTPYRPVEERLKDYSYVAPEAEVGLVREAGFSHAFTSDWGVVTSASDKLKLPRVSLYSQSVLGNALLLAREALR